MARDPYDRLAARIDRIERAQKAAAKARLGNASLEAGAINAYDLAGQQMAAVGRQFDDTYTAATVAGPVPPVPTVPIVEGGPGLANVAWDGGFIEGALTPMDFARVEVYVSISSITDPMPSMLAGTIETPQGAEVTLLREAGTYYVRLASRALSGKISALSAEVTVDVLAQIDTSAIEEELSKKISITRSTTAPDVDGVTDGDLWWRLDESGRVVAQWRWVTGGGWLSLPISGVLIAAETISAAQIAAESLTADRFVAGTITARELGALAVTAAKIAAGAITADKLSLGVIATNRISNPGFELVDGAPVLPVGQYTSVPNWSNISGPNGEFTYWEYGTGDARTGNGRMTLRRAQGATETSNSGCGARSSMVPVKAGESVRFSFFHRNPVAARSSWQVRIEWFGAASSTVPITETSNTFSDPGTDNTSDWIEWVGTYAVPSGAINARMVILFTGQKNLTAWKPNVTTYMWVDDVAAIGIGTAAMELTPAGIRMWNAAGVETVSLSGPAARIAAGTLATAVSGNRVEITTAEAAGGPASGRRGIIRLYGETSEGLVFAPATIEASVESSAAGDSQLKVSAGPGLAAAPSSILLASALKPEGGRESTAIIEAEATQISGRLVTPQWPIGKIRAASTNVTTGSWQRVPGWTNELIRRGVDYTAPIYTIKTSGWYDVYLHASFGTGGTANTRRGIAVGINGTTPQNERNVGYVSGTSALSNWQTQVMVYLNAGDTVGCLLYQDSGVTLSVTEAVMTVVFRTV